MKSELLRLFLPVGIGVLLGLGVAFEGFLRAWRGAPDSPNRFLGPSGRPGAIPVTMMIQGFFETPALFAMIGGIIALQLTN